MGSAGINVGPEKIRFEREINGRKVCKKFIARLEPVLLFEDGYIRTHCNTVNYNWPRQLTRVWVLLNTNIRLRVFKRDLISYILEPLNNATPRHVFLAFQTIKTRFFGNGILETEINFLNLSAKRLHKC